MTNIYWYAPFNNAGEMATASSLAASPDVDLTVQSIARRFGEPLGDPSDGRFELIRDLPAPSGEETRRSVPDRLRVAVERAWRRHRLVRSGRFDLLHLHTYNPLTDWAAIPLLRRRSRVLVQSVHNVRPHDSVVPQRIETQLLRIGYRSCTAIFVAHDLLARSLIEDFAVPADRVFVVPFALSVDLLEVRRPHATEGPVRYLFFGTLRNNKGVEVLIDALDLLASADPRPDREYRVHFAGRGEARLEDRVRDLARRDPRVTIEIGFIAAERRAELYRDADCVLLPYTDLNAQSGVLHDAYASRLPVIASDVRALGAKVRADGTGWVVAASDPAALARAISEVNSADGERRRRGERAAELAAAHSPSAIAGLLLNQYDRLLRDAGPATCPETGHRSRPGPRT